MVEVGCYKRNLEEGAKHFSRFTLVRIIHLHLFYETVLFMCFFEGGVHEYMLTNLM